MKQIFARFGIPVLLVMLTLFGFTLHEKDITPVATSVTKTTTPDQSDLAAGKAKKVSELKQIPTIFIHGLGGRYKSETPLATPAVRAGAASWGMLVSVKADGQVVVRGSLAHKKNPIILLRFEDNLAGQYQDAEWLRDVLTVLKAKYGVSKYNIVGHSMGAYAAVYYAERLSHSSDQPKLNKLVTLAGPFNGIMHLRGDRQMMLSKDLQKLVDDSPNSNKLTATGRPETMHPEYKALLKTRSQFPSSASVLNIYGNVENGTNSDTAVTTVSARSLRYVLENQAKAYAAKELHGLNATHFQLHNNNPEVQRLIAWYLWRAELGEHVIR